MKEKQRGQRDGGKLSKEDECRSCQEPRKKPRHLRGSWKLNTEVVEGNQMGPAKAAGREAEKYVLTPYFY